MIVSDTVVYFTLFCETCNKDIFVYNTNNNNEALLEAHVTKFNHDPDKSTYRISSNYSVYKCKSCDWTATPYNDEMSQAWIEQQQPQVETHIKENNHEDFELVILGWD